MSLSFTPFLFFIYAFIGGICSSMFGPGPIAAMVLKVLIFFLLLSNSIVQRNKTNMQNILL